MQLASTMHRIPLFLLLVLSNVCLHRGSPVHVPPSTANQGHYDVSNGRLPEYLKPTHYSLELQPDIYGSSPSMTFEGHVQITIKSLEPTGRIYLNVANLTIEEDSLVIQPVDEELPNPGIQAWELFDDLQLMRIDLQNSMIRGGIYFLRISFSGIISPSDLDQGLFWDQYPQHDEMRYVMGSQLQPVYARRIFPCFDEPTFKATFGVTIVRKMHMTSLTCGDLIKSELREDGWIADVFDTTPIMPTYLLAFAVVDYPHLQVISQEGYKIRVWARSDVLHAAEYAMTIAESLVDWFDDYTGIQNPVTKIDKVAFPTWGGAMENWGLVLYSENLFLWDPTWFETDRQLLISNVVTHELTHYWFGNLVSCGWWDELWLNEGFASYFESMALQDPLGWPGSELVMDSRLVPMMEVDEKNTSTPVRPHIPTPWHAEDAFSSSTYGKGAFMLRMIHQVLGPSSFQKALRKYLNDYAFSATVSNDLWAVFNQVAVEDSVPGPGGLPVNFTDLFTPWIDQSGFPLLKVHRDYLTSQVTYTQERYNSSDLTLPSSEYDYLWNIPITKLSQSESTLPNGVSHWTQRQDAETVNDPTLASEWTLLNVETFGLYRIEYDLLNFNRLVVQLQQNHSRIPSESRQSLIADAFHFARSRRSSEVSAFETTKYLKNERDPLPWFRAEESLVYPSRILARFNDSRILLKAYIRNIVDNVYEYLGWSNEGHVLQRIHRQKILRMACQNGNPQCIEKSKTLFFKWTADPAFDGIDVDHRQTVYCTAIKGGTQGDWQIVYDRYLLAGPPHLPNTTVTRLALQKSLSCSMDYKILEGYLQLLFQPDEVPEGEKSVAMKTLAQSPQGRSVVWNHLYLNWRSHPVPVGVDRFAVFMATVEDFASNEDELQFEAFLAKYPAEDDKEAQVYAEAAAIVEKNQQWVADNLDSLNDWLLETLHL